MSFFPLVPPALSPEQFSPAQLEAAAQALPDNYPLLQQHLRNRAREPRDFLSQFIPPDQRFPTKYRGPTTETDPTLPLFGSQQIRFFNLTASQNYISYSVEEARWLDYELLGLCAKPSSNQLASEQLNKDFGKLLKAQKFSDVTIRVNRLEDYPAHKNIIHARCPALLEETSGHKKEIIEINGYTAEQVTEMLQFMYTNELAVEDEDQAKKLLELAHRYKFASLKMAIEDKVLYQIDKDNCLRWLEEANRLECKGIKQACFKQMLSNMTAVKQSKEFGDLSKDSLFEIIEFMQKKL